MPAFQKPNNGQYCDQVCTNTNGSYLCSCQPGYELQKEDNRTCIALNFPGIFTNYVDKFFYIFETYLICPNIIKYFEYT